MLAVTDPADDLQLLSEEELRVAVGLEPDDASQDAALAIYGLRAAAALAGACGIAKAGYAPTLAPLRGEAPRTLHAETLTETLRIRPGCQYRTIYLARWPLLSVMSITEGTSDLLTAEDWEIDIPGGSITRVSGDDTLYWPAGRVTVEYEAGYDTIPADLKGYASRLVSLYYTSEGEDPNQKRVEIPGVISIDRWVDTETDSIVPHDIMCGLIRDGYRKPVLK